LKRHNHQQQTLQRLIGRYRELLVYTFGINKDQTNTDAGLFKHYGVIVLRAANLMLRGMARPT
jgi:hypothetical protein